MRSDRTILRAAVRKASKQREMDGLLRERSALASIIDGQLECRTGGERLDRWCLSLEIAGLQRAIKSGTASPRRDDVRRDDGRRDDAIDDVRDDDFAEVVA